MLVSTKSDLEIMIGDEQLEPLINSTTPNINDIDIIFRAQRILPLNNKIRTDRV